LKADFKVSRVILSRHFNHASQPSFISSLLRRENDLIEIDVEVDPYLELAEIHRRVIAQGGAALLFKRQE
jgi:3-polyprenyl-4-hydroxybenzoate decarboxylase